MTYSIDQTREILDQVEGEITEQDKQMRNGGGYGAWRHNFYVDGSFAARETKPGSGEYVFVNNFSNLNG